MNNTAFTRLDWHDPESYLKIGLYTYVLGAALSISLAQLGLVTALIAAIAALIKKRDFGVLRSALDLPLASFLALTLLSIPFAIDPARSLAYLPKHWLLLMFYLAFAFVKREDYPRYIMILAAVGALASIYGIMQHFWGVDLLHRAGESILKKYNEDKNTFLAVGFMTHHITFGGLLAQIMALVAAVFIIKPDLGRNQLFFLGGCFVLMLAGLGLSMARSGWLGLLGAILLMAIMRNIRLFFKLSLGIIGLVLIVYFTVPTIQRRIDSIFEFQKNANRFYMWRGALRMIRDYPLTGIGEDNYDILFYDKKSPYYEKGMTETARGNPHNAYLTLGVTRGVGGILVYLWIWMTFFGRTGRSYREVIDEGSWKTAALLGALGAVTSFLIVGFFETNYADSEVAMLAWFITGIGMSFASKRN